jgi:hypothetical protein
MEDQAADNRPIKPPKPAHVSITQAAGMLGMNKEVVRRHIKRLGIPTIQNPKNKRDLWINVMDLIPLSTQERRGDSRGQMTWTLTGTWQDGSMAGQTVEIAVPRPTRTRRKTEEEEAPSE